MNIKKYGELSVKALNESQKTYSVGEIVRLGLLKNHKGEPYKHKATVLRLVGNSKRKKTPWGNGYSVTQKEIDAINKRWKSTGSY